MEHIEIPATPLGADALDSLRQKNAKYNSKWLFPIRMENQSFIEWVPNIVEALGRFKRTIDEIGWNRLIAKGKIAAEGADNDLLRRWWLEGWKDTPCIAAARGMIGNPILRTRLTPLGEELYLIYPTMQKACADLRCGELVVTALCNKEKVVHNPIDGNLYAMKEIVSQHYENYNPDRKPWTLFDGNNKIVGFFTNRLEMANYLHLPLVELERAHTDRYNYIGNGYWMWYEKWGFMPISPNDEPLGRNWRTKCMPTENLGGDQN